MSTKRKFFSLASSIGVIFMIVGIAVSFNALTNNNRVEEIRSNGGIEVTATIISIDSKSSSTSTGKNTFTAQYEYSDQADNTYTIKGSKERTGMPSPSYEVGDTNTVMYDPEDPQNAFIGTSTVGGVNLYLVYLPLIFVLVGLIVFITEIIKLAKTRKL